MEITFWYNGKFKKFFPVLDTTYVKECDMLVIKYGEMGSYTVSHWDVDQIYNLNTK